MVRLSEIAWTEKTSFVDEWLERDIFADRLPAGLEATVWKLGSNSESAVLKVWDKDSDPDVRFQYGLLAALRRGGLSVSASYGWGYTAGNRKALLTSYDGSPLSEVTSRQTRHLADLLSEVHRFPYRELDSVLLKTYDFTAYFFPKVNEHPDIRAPLLRLVDRAKPKQSHLIHGDFNLGNVLIRERTYALIDWTNAQIGDARYDFAWAAFLIDIYLGEEQASAFRSAYLAKSGFASDEIRPFEAIACLRWLLLRRIADLPADGRTIERVNRIIVANPDLSRSFARM